MRCIAFQQGASEDGGDSQNVKCLRVSASSLSADPRQKAHKKPKEEPERASKRPAMDPP